MLIRYRKFLLLISKQLLNSSLSIYLRLRLRFQKDSNIIFNFLNKN
jgi:hypothetical protein